MRLRGTLESNERHRFCNENEVSCAMIYTGEIILSILFCIDQ